MVLPPAHDAAAWFVETARAAVASGERVGAGAVRLLMALAPGDPAIAAAIDRLEEPEDTATLAAYARAALEHLREAARGRDEALARETVTGLEAEVLRAYRPSHGLGSFEDDAAVALAMLAAYDIGADEAHLMMAEELVLGLLRRDWHRRGERDVCANCEAAVALAALAEHTGKAEYRHRALEVMTGYAATYRSLGLRAAPYVSALQVIS